jgi:hypothetical protein
MKISTSRLEVILQGNHNNGFKNLEHISKTTKRSTNFEKITTY